MTKNIFKKAENKSWSLIPFIIILLAIFYLSSFSLSENRYAMILRFGKVVDVKENPGLHFKIPFINQVKIISKATEIYDISPSDVITKDKKSMIADDFILWKVTDPVKYYQTLNASKAYAEDRVGVAVYNATKNTISSMSQDEVIEARGDYLTKFITDEANSDIGGYGIHIIGAKIKALDLPDDNKDAVYQRMISERENIAASYKAKGDADAQKIRNETDKKVTVMKAEAEKDAEIKRAEGEEEYMKTLSEIYDTPEKEAYYDYTRGLDSLKKSFDGKGEKTLILDKDSELVKILYGR